MNKNKSFFLFIKKLATELPNCVMCNYTDFCETTYKNKLKKIKNTTIVYILQLKK